MTSVEAPNNASINEEELFYFIYGLFHSKDYIIKFGINLKKSLPRIPIISKYEDFVAISKAGEKLANLHLNYEQIKPYSRCKIFMYPGADYKVTKMKFGKSKNNNKDKTIIEYNDKITISKKPTPLKFNTLYSDTEKEYKEFKYTPNFKRQISIIDPETTEEVKPTVYFDEEANEVRGKCKLKANKPYFAFEIKEKKD